jgi:hypothetical protein
MIAKCIHCPLKDEERPCLAQTTKHTRWCWLIDPASPGFDARYRDTLLGHPDPPPTPRPVKPRVALGVNQHKMAPPGCKTCGQADDQRPAVGSGPPAA